MNITVRMGAARRRTIAAMAAMAILAAAGPLLAADFYASPGGDDTNACTSGASPCKTIQAAIGKAAANDTVHVGQGNYPFSNQRIVIDKPGLKLIGDNSPFDASSVPGAPVKAAGASVLQAASGSVSGTNGMIWVKNVANVEVRNLYIELSSSKAKEGVVATGAIDESVIDNNFIKIGGLFNTSNIGISINLAVSSDSSVPGSETRTSGQFVTISNNAIVPDTASYAIPKRAVAMQNSVGTVSGNQVAGLTQDMWIQSPSGGSAHHALTLSGNWFFGALQLYVSSGSNLQSTMIDGNHFTAPPSSVWGNGSEAHSLRVMGANGGSPTIISNNEFTGFGGVYRALWVMSRPNVIIEANTFTPAAAQSDFTAIVVGNREVWNGLPAPNPYAVVIRANTFNANAATAGNKAKAILFVDDNDDGGVASFTSAIVGGENPADANSFDASIGWYIALDDRSCIGQNHDSTSGGCNGGAPYAIGKGIAYSGGSNQSSQKRPFKWDIQAAGNSFGGVYMPAMTQGQYDAVWAKTYDKHDAATDSSVGNVLYGYPSITTGTITFSPTSFTYDGNAHTVTASLDGHAEVPCVVTPDTVTDAGTTNVSATCTNALYNVTGSAAVVVAKATGTVVWGTLNFTYDASAHAITASLSEDNAATCTVTPPSVTDAGDTAVHADCTGTNYMASADATAHVAKATGTVVWGTLNFTYDASAHAITASLQEDNAATCTVTPSSVTDAGDTLVHADCAGTNYTASADATAHVAKAAQSITDFAADPANPVYSDGGTFTLSATAGASGETVIFGSTTPSVCTVAGNTVTMLSIGTCALTADQAGNTNYDAAPQVTLDVTISEPPQPDLALSIDAGRDFVQYGKLLTYTITVQNNGTATANANVAAALPSTLINGSWICSASTVGAACGAPTGTGDLNDNGAVIPKDGELVYMLTATVNDDPGLTTDQISTTATATVNGTPADSNPSNNSATENTQIVIFRDGFEQGGDGAQETGAALTHAVGSLDEVATLMLDADLAPQAVNTPTPLLRATDASGREVFRIDSLRTANDVLVRVINSDANGHESHSDWIALGAQTVALALASTTADTHALILLGAEDASLQAAIPAWAVLPLGVYSAQ